MRRPVVLVVEDDDDVREIACEFLVSLGFAAVSARNGEQGLHSLERHEQVDLLFTDVVMPGRIDGIELARLALERRPELAVIITSGFVRHAHDRGAAALPADIPFLRKPYRLDDLETMIRELLFPRT